MKSEDMSVQLVERNNCVLCGALGMPFYNSLEDRLFGVDGSWSISQCENGECGLAWLNPSVAEESLNAIYNNYYTHSTQQVSEPSLEKGVVAKTFSILRKFADQVLGIDRLTAESECMYLSMKEPGKVLEVGCGSGKRLLHFRTLGWNPDGQEVDPEAAEYARELTGEKVYLCKIDSPELPKIHYDAVVLNHVLEHVPRPVEFLKSCASMLVPGGTLVVTVPNFGSIRHRRFNEDWWGLDPPRHLFHFSPCNLLAAAKLASLFDARTFTSVAQAETITLGCYQVKNGLSNEQLSKSMRIRAVIAQYLSIFEQWIDPKSGDECVLMWEKPT